MSKQILLIDDDVDDQLIFREITEEISPDIECITARNGLDGLHRLATMHPGPTMIFLDLNMPFISGWECLDRIRQDESTNAIPVIIMTTSANEADIKQALRLGVKAFITKTADLACLRQMIREILAGEAVR